MWSNMARSSMRSLIHRSYRGPAAAACAFLLFRGAFAVARGRNTVGAAKAADEVAEIRKTRVPARRGHARTVRERYGGAAQAHAYEVAVRWEPHELVEQPAEVERADADLATECLERERLGEAALHQLARGVDALGVPGELARAERLRARRRGEQCRKNVRHERGERERPHAVSERELDLPVQVGQPIRERGARQHGVP